MNKEIEEFANEISLEHDDVPLSQIHGIERAFYIQMATNLIKKGYRKSAMPSKGTEKSHADLVEEFVDVYVLRYGLKKILGDVKPFGHVYMCRDINHIAPEELKKDFALMRMNTKCLTTPKLSAAPLVPLDEDEVYKVMENHAPVMTPLGEEITREQAKAVCSKFGATQPSRTVSVEIISKVLTALHEVTGEVYLGNITKTSEAIHALLKERA